MPGKALRPCREPGCAAYALPGAAWCARHKPVREDRCLWYSTAKWVRERGAFLRAHPLCEECRRQGRIRAASQVDHIRPHRGDAGLFWDQGNWQSLCAACHSRKTAAEDGGFGHAARVREDDPVRSEVRAREFITKL